MIEGRKGNRHRSAASTSESEEKLQNGKELEDDRRTKGSEERIKDKSPYERRCKHLSYHTLLGARRF